MELKFLIKFVGEILQDNGIEIDFSEARLKIAAPVK